MEKRKPWTKSEIDLIKNGVPDIEILQRTGRTICALDKMKRQLKKDETREYTETMVVYASPMAETLTQEEKESRLYDLMAIMRVRLG